MKKIISQGIWWSSLSVVPSRIINYVSIIILARILTPEIFGEFSYAIIIFQYFALAENPGLQSAFIYLKKPPEEMAGTFLILNSIIALSLFIILNVLAPLFEVFFENRQLALLLHFVSLSFLFNCSAFVNAAWLVKTFKFKKILYPVIISTFLSAVISITMALSGCGIWSLVAKHLSVSFISALVLYIVTKKRIQLRFDKRLAVSMLKYGLPLHFIIILGFIRTNVDYLFVGKMLGTVSLGVYRQAFNIITLPMLSLSLIISRIAFPAFASIIEQKDLFRNQFSHVFKMQIALISLFSFLFILIPDSIVFTFFGKKWEGMIPVLRILAVFLLLKTIIAPFFECYKAKGLIKIRIYISIAVICILLPSFYIGAQFGLIGIAYAHLFAFLPFFLIEFLLLKKYFDIKWKETFLAVKKILLYQILLFCLCVLIKAIISSNITFYHQLRVSILGLLAASYYIVFFRKLRQIAA